MIRSGETESGPAAGEPPLRRRAALALMAGAVLSPSLGRAQSLAQTSVQTPVSGGAAPGTAGPSGAQPQGASETLTTGRDTSQRMTTPVFVNGLGPFNFLVDTGANRSGIASELAAQLQLRAGQPVAVHGIAGAVLTPTVDIEELRVGSFHLKLDDAPTFARRDLGADGLIGLDLLHDRVVTLDFSRDRIEVSRRSYAADTLQAVLGPEFIGAVIPARQRFGQLTIIDAVAERAHMTCFIDTGADQSVGNEALRRAVQAQVPPDKWLSAEVMIHSATGQSVPGLVALVPSMRIGGVDFTRFGLAFADLHTFDLWQLHDQPALLVGMDLLRLFDMVTIDFASREVVLEKR